MCETENSNIYSDFPWANIRIVLVETSHPGNIGAVARAMKNMQLESLYLVRPQQLPDRHSAARSSGATDVLNNAVICNTLAEAISDCRLVIAASARLRSIPWPTADAAEAAHKLVENFRKELSDSAQSEIGESGFEKLALMINEAIQEDRRITANVLDEVVKTLRKDIDIPELGM